MGRQEVLGGPRFLNAKVKQQAGTFPTFLKSGRWGLVSIFEVVEEAHLAAVWLRPGRENLRAGRRSVTLDPLQAPYRRDDRTEVHRRTAMAYPAQDDILTLTIIAAMAVTLIGHYLAQELADWVPPALSGSP
jgi:hypothetical protein